MKSFAFAVLAVLTAWQGPGVAEVSERLHAYLLAYEPKLSELMADEAMRQETAPAHADIKYNERLSSGRYEKRELESEVAFVALPASAGWLGFRRVMKVGRQVVGDGTGALKDVLAGGDKSDYSKAKEMLADGARFNLGEPRTINLPNLPLELLHPRHAKRFSVRVAGQEPLRGKQTTKLVFVEIFTHTIIKAADGGDMRSTVAAWAETATGRLLRAHVYSRDTRANAWPFDAVIAVDFAEHAALGLLVPSTMKEEFFAGHDRRTWGEARYTNYRRFQTSARILPQ